MSDSLSDSSEDLYSLNTTTTNIFDFTNSDTYVSGEAFPQTQTTNKLKRFVVFFNTFLKFVFVSLVKLCLEFGLFTCYSLVYIKEKFSQTVHYLDISKDKIVSTLMWRRGLAFRPATHGGVMVVAAIAIVAGGLFSRGEIVAQDLTVSEAVLKSTNVAKTIVPTDRPRSDIISYTVASGDTLSTLGEKFGVSIETIKWANNIGDTDLISPNQTLKIPPVTGVVYQVKSGDNLDKVAKAYSADKQTIVDFPFNYIDDSLSLRVGQTLFVPNGSIPAPAKKYPVYAKAPAVNKFVVGSGLLSWPVPAHISQYYSWYHTGIDMANPYGTPIYAAAGGTVIDSKKQYYSFGWYCIIDIGNGYTTAYAHMSKLACSLGQKISRGQYIGAIGTTGRATGPHLHLEVRRNGKAVNPLSLLK